MVQGVVTFAGNCFCMVSVFPNVGAHLCYFVITIVVSVGYTVTFFIVCRYPIFVLPRPSVHSGRFDLQIPLVLILHIPQENTFVIISTVPNRLLFFIILYNKYIHCLMPWKLREIAIRKSVCQFCPFAFCIIGVYCLLFCIFATTISLLYDYISW